MSETERAAIVEMEIKIEDVKIPEGRNSGMGVEALMNSIDRIRLLHPITISKDHTLIAGRNRLEACKRLGMKTIRARIVDVSKIEAELIEIDENIVKKKLSTIESAELMNRRKKLYILIHPQTTREAHLIQNRSETISVREKEVPSFSKDTADKLGVSTRAVEMKVQIATEIDPNVKKKIAGTSLENNQKELLALARLKKDAQIRAVAGIGTKAKGTKTRKKVICLDCFNCIEIHLSQKEKDAGYKQLVKCSKEFFGPTEKYAIQEVYKFNDTKDKPGCPEYDTEPMDKKPSTPVKRLKALEELPPELLAEVWIYVKGPCELYIPSAPKEKSLELRNKIMAAYEETQSLRGTANKVGCHRNTVRKVVREK